MMCKVTLVTAVRKAEASGGSTGMQGTAGIQGRRHWATQGTKAAAVGASGHEGEGVEYGVACWPTPPLFK